MKQFLAVVFVLAALSVCSAVTLDEVIQLSKLKTGDDLIIKIIEKGKLDQAVSLADVIRLKKEGVSDPVIEAMLKQSNSDRDMRKYTVTNKQGKTVSVFTNLDENGQRMGAPAPEPAAVFPLPEPPKEVNVVVRHQEPEMEQDYGQEYGQAYAPSYSGYGGGYYPYTGSYLPYYSQGYSDFHQCCGSQNGSSNRTWGTFRNSNPPTPNRPQVRPPMQSSPAPRASFGGARSARGWKTR